jgi:hypothetical protein
MIVVNWFQHFFLQDVQQNANIIIYRNFYLNCLNFLSNVYVNFFLIFGHQKGCINAYLHINVTKISVLHLNQQYLDKS